MFFVISIPDFHKVVRLVAGVQEEPDFLHKVRDARFFLWPSYIHHPFVCGVVTLLTLIHWDVPAQKTNNGDSLDASVEADQLFLVKFSGPKFQQDLEGMFLL